MNKKKTLSDLIWEAGIFDDPVGDEIFELFAKQKTDFIKKLEKLIKHYENNT